MKESDWVTSCRYVCSIHCFMIDANQTRMKRSHNNCPYDGKVRVYPGRRLMAHLTQIPPNKCRACYLCIHLQNEHGWSCTEGYGYKICHFGTSEIGYTHWQLLRKPTKLNHHWPSCQGRCLSSKQFLSYTFIFIGLKDGCCWARISLNLSIKVFWVGYPAI